MEIQVYADTSATVAEQPFEYVERKGLGHPDSICDSVMECAAEALRKEYKVRCGRVLHHNLDKALLVAGQSEPRLGGGRIMQPLQIIAGDRATSQFDGLQIPVDDVVESSVLDWIGKHLRFVDPQRHVAFRSEIKPGSAELTGIFEREIPLANDTSAAVGYAPLSETEQVVLATEHYINSEDFKTRFPVAGEDVKVMGVREEQRLALTIAIAFVDQYVPSVASYFEQKEAIREDILAYVRGAVQRIDDVSVALNTLDDRSLGESGMYLTVIGTSAESGDGGEVGRGNSVNGLISLNRPTSNEAAAGKNRTCHVGNIYNHLSHEIARQIVHTIDPVREAYVWLCSQIGQPVDQPWSSSVRVSLDPTCQVSDLCDSINAILREALRSQGAGEET